LSASWNLSSVDGLMTTAALWLTRWTIFADGVRIWDLFQRPTLAVLAQPTTEVVELGLQ
jgi:hypothetical protein